jgi:hypothetical protein
MADVRAAHEAALAFLARPGVVGIWVGYKITGGRRTRTVGVCVGVRKKLPLTALRADQLIPATVQDVPTDVQEVGEIQALAPLEYTARRRPCPGGFSVGHLEIAAGTLGAWVKREGDERWYILSNNHVLANESRARLGDPILQPGPYDGGSILDRIATLTAVAPFGDPVLVDGALAVADDPTFANPTIHGIGAPAGWRDAQLGERVSKSGRTTEVTSGEITGLNAVVNVQFDTGLRRCADQIIIGPGGFSAGGDSGSLIIAAADRKVVGLLFAGSAEITIANRMSHVVEALGIRFETVEEPGPPPPPPETPGKKRSPFCRWWAAFKIANRRLARRRR